MRRSSVKSKTLLDLEAHALELQKRKEQGYPRVKRRGRIRHEVEDYMLLKPFLEFVQAQKLIRQNTVADRRVLRVRQRHRRGNERRNRMRYKSL